MTTVSGHVLCSTFRTPVPLIPCNFKSMSARSNSSFPIRLIAAFSAIYGGDAVSVAFQQLLQKEADAAFIVDDENLRAL